MSGARVGSILKSGARPRSPFISQRHCSLSIDHSTLRRSSHVANEVFVWIGSCCQTKHPIKAIRSMSASGIRNRHEYRTAPRTQRRDVPGEGVEEVQATASGTSRFVKLRQGNAHITCFHDRCLGHDVYAPDGCEQTEEAPVQGHELLATCSRDRAGTHHRCGCGWCLDDGPDKTPDRQVCA